MSEPVARPDTTDMIVLHKSLHREFALQPELVVTVPAGDTGPGHHVRRSPHPRSARVTTHLDAATIDRLLDPASHTGLSADIARAAAQRARARQPTA